MSKRIKSRSVCDRSLRSTPAPHEHGVPNLCVLKAGKFRDARKLESRAFTSRVPDEFSAHNKLFKHVEYLRRLYSAWHFFGEYCRSFDGYKFRLELLPCKETCTIPTGLSDKISSWTGEIDHKNYSICTICYLHADLQLIRELVLKKSLTITWITSVAVRSRAGFAGRSCLIIASSELRIHISRSIQDALSHSISIKRTYLWPKT